MLEAEAAPEAVFLMILIWRFDISQVNYAHLQGQGMRKLPHTTNSTNVLMNYSVQYFVLLAL